MRDRCKLILKELEEKGNVRVARLSEQYGCSEVTIRKDIKEMEDKGLLVRTHGGAICIQEKPSPSYPCVSESLLKNMDRKKQIAVKAYEFITDGDTIIIDDASTTFYLATCIREHPEKRLAVVTNSLPAGNELSGLKHVELYMVGGYVGGYTAATMGEEAASHMKDFRADKAFIGAHGINFKAGLTSIATPQMQMKQAMLKVSEKVYVLADSSKFSGGYLSVICPIEAVDQIITDAELSDSTREMARKWQVPLVVA